MQCSLLQYHGHAVKATRVPRLSPTAIYTCDKITKLSAYILGIELKHELVQSQGACALILTFFVFVAMAHVG